MPAKFVNLFQFHEIKIFSQLITKGAFSRSVDQDSVIAGFYIIDTGPDQEFVPRQARDGYPGMVEGEDFLLSEAFFVVKEIAIGNAKADMYNSDYLVAGQEHDQADPQEEKDLYQAEKQVHFRHLAKDVLSCKYQDKDVQGNDQLAPEIYSG